MSRGAMPHIRRAVRCLRLLESHRANESGEARLRVLTRIGRESSTAGDCQGVKELLSHSQGAWSRESRRFREPVGSERGPSMHLDGTS